VVALIGLQVWLQRLGAGAQNGNLFVYEIWLHRLLGALCLLLGVTAGGFAFWLRGMALASRSERRWPPTSMRTSADVRIRYLTSADTLVSQLLATAIALGLVAAALCGWAFWLFLAG
jgi:ABC-type cobalamin transport system permease subunit